MKLKSENYKGYDITFIKYPNDVILGETRGMSIGIYKTKKETFDYIKKRIDIIEDGWKKRNKNSDYMSLEQFKKEIGV